MTRRTMTAAVAMLAFSTAACDDDPVATEQLSPEDVAGIYAVCSLDFDPEGDLLREVDIIEAGFELDNTEVRSPQLQADASGDFQILFTPKGQFVERSLIGRFNITPRGVNLTFSGGSASPDAYLLPPQLELSYQATPRSLTTAATPEYTVNRADYARLAGVSESGLAERIPGRLMVVFQAGGADCG